MKNTIAQLEQSKKNYKKNIKKKKKKKKKKKILSISTEQIYKTFLIKKIIY